MLRFQCQIYRIVLIGPKGESTLSISPDDQLSLLVLEAMRASFPVRSGERIERKLCKLRPSSDARLFDWSQLQIAG